MCDSDPDMPTKPKLHKAYFRGFAGWFWDWVGIKSAGDAMTEHALTVERKGRFLASATIIILVCIGAGTWIRGCYDDSEIRSSEDNARSNDALAKTYESQLGAVNSQLLQTKVDANELKTENASLQQELASYKTAHIMELSSNFDHSISNLLSSGTINQPDLILISPQALQSESNQIPDLISSNITIKLYKTRETLLAIGNRGNAVAQGVSVLLAVDMEGTNVVAGRNWHYYGFELLHGKMVSIWELKSPDALPNHGLAPMPSFIISTNYHGHNFEGEFMVFADNFPLEMIPVKFVLEQ